MVFMPRKTAPVNLTKRQRERISEMEKEFSELGQHRWADQCKSLLLIDAGYDMENVHKIVQRPYSTVQEWSREFRNNGLKSLKHKTSDRGRKKKLGDHERKLLCKALIKGPQEAGYLCNVWTSSLIADYIQKRWGVEYHPGHVRRLLPQLGFSLQFPREKLALADQEAQEKWLNETYPEIKKTQKNKEQ